MAQREPCVGCALHEPGGGRRTDAAVGDPVAEPRRHAPEGVRLGDQPAEPHRAHVGRRIQHPAQSAGACVEPAAAAQPADAVGPADHLDVTARLADQGRQLDCALPAADHGGASAGEVAQVAQVRAVLHERCLQVREHRGSPHEGPRAGGDHHAPGVQPLTVGEVNGEAAAHSLDTRGAPAVHARDRVALVPARVADVVRQRHGPVQAHLLLGLVVVERQRPGRIRDRRGLPRGAQEHADRHLALPELHRLAERVDVGAHVAQVGGAGETVWAGADHHDIERSTVGH